MTASATQASIFDVNNLAALKGAVKKDDPKALKTAAQQFEALFMQMVLKSMRDATPHEGMFDSEQTRMYESLLDQQLSQVMSSNGSIGLAKVIERQLMRANAEAMDFPEGLPLVPPAATGYRQEGGVRSLPLPPQNAPLRPLPLDRFSPVPANVDTPTAPGAVVAPVSGDAQVSQSSREFVDRVWPGAVDAGRTTGIPAHFLVAQAALETGWGRAEPRFADGRPSYNVLGIKAGRSWSGPTVEASTTEYVDGVAQRQSERFRAYGSYAEAFRDYANLLASNPRYAGVLGTQDAGTFARGLQRAGYATDPVYADKLTRIIGGQSLRTALAG